MTLKKLFSFYIFGFLILFLISCASIRERNLPIVDKVPPPSKLKKSVTVMVIHETKADGREPDRTADETSYSMQSLTILKESGLFSEVKTLNKFREWPDWLEFNKTSKFDDISEKADITTDLKMILVVRSDRNITWWSVPAILTLGIIPGKEIETFLIGAKIEDKGVTVGKAFVKDAIVKGTASFPYPGYRKERVVSEEAFANALRNLLAKLVADGIL